jgi:hypothetical protein
MDDILTGVEARRNALGRTLPAWGVTDLLLGQGRKIDMAAHPTLLDTAREDGQPTRQEPLGLPGPVCIQDALLASWVIWYRSREKG